MKIMIALLAIATLTGCATPQNNVERLSMQARVSDTIPQCEGQQECQTKWDAAQAWVSNNAGFKIQTNSSAIIETYNSPEGSMDMGMKVVKEPMGNNKNRFVLSVKCGNWLLGCNRDPLQAIQDFNDYVNRFK